MVIEIESCNVELGREVAIGEIDCELRRLWEADSARTKASLMNLAIYSEVRGALEKNSVLIRELTREHACRAILVGLDRSVPKVTTRAWITAHCHLAGGSRAVCCEQIAFALTGRSIGRLRNVVFAHLASDLPLVFWWQGELSSRFGERLYSEVDRLIIDSSEWSDPAGSYERIGEALEETRGQMVLHDLEWSRSWQIRQGLASLFDEPVAQRALPGVGRVRIVHHPRHRCAALQLLAWLADRCGWREATELGLELAPEPCGREGHAFERPGGGGVCVVLEANGEGAPVERLELGGDGFCASVERVAGQKHLRLCREIEGCEVCSLVPADEDEPVALVGGQLARGGRNSVFARLLPRFLEVLGG
jgi:glucose-6-phosphate dehydrogenase assembly protein OpcA